MQLTIICTFVLFALVCNFAVSSAYPQRSTIDRFDSREGYYFDPVYNERNTRLRRTDYTDADFSRSYYPVQTFSGPIRREDTDTERAYKYTPLVRYKSTRTKRKKLFVPNLWG